MVPERGRVGHGRSDDGGKQRQDRVGHFHQTFPSSQHHGPLPVSGHVSTGQICQEHFSQRPLHRGVQESQGSIGHAQRGLASVSRQVAEGVGRLSQRHVETVWVSGVGSTSGQQRRSKTREPSVKRRGIRASVSVGLILLTRCRPVLDDALPSSSPSAKTR